MPGKPHLCWDSCVYISLLTGENRTPEEMKNLYAIENLVNQGRAVAFSSTVALVEVLECHLTPEQVAKFKGLIGNPDTPFLPVDTKVAELAHEIRSYYKGAISAPDAIFLATAIHYEATAFHTYDGTSKRKREGDLLRLTQPIAGKYRMPITVPEIPVEPPPELLRAAVETEVTEEESEPLLAGIDMPLEEAAPLEEQTAGQQIADAITKVIPVTEAPQEKNQPKIEKAE
jgi:predicted nucleic acid-binding protein